MKDILKVLFYLLLNYKKEIKIIEAKFKAKLQIILKTNISKDFNDDYIIFKITFIIVV